MVNGGQILTAETPGTPYLMLADAARLQQVFWNLLRNATKFTPERGRIAIFGGIARNVLIGGTGADSISGGSADDALIGGSVACSEQFDANSAILAEWTRIRSPRDSPRMVAREE